MRQTSWLGPMASEKVVTALHPCSVINPLGALLTHPALLCFLHHQPGSLCHHLPPRRPLPPHHLLCLPQMEVVGCPQEPHRPPPPGTWPTSTLATRFVRIEPVTFRTILNAALTVTIDTVGKQPFSTVFRNGQFHDHYRTDATGPRRDEPALPLKLLPCLLY